MTYNDLIDKQKEILSTCGRMIKRMGRVGIIINLTEFDMKINKLIALQEQYQQEQAEIHRRAGQSRSEKKAQSSRENGKKGGRPPRGGSVSSDDTQKSPC